MTPPSAGCGAEAPPAQKKPGPHSPVGAVRPAEAQKAPGTQAAHSAADARWSALLAVPAGQGVALPLPWPQKEPGGQGAGVTVPPPHTKRAGHGAQAACEPAEAKEPAAQGTGAAAPAAHALPGGQPSVGVASLPGQ